MLDELNLYLVQNMDEVLKIALTEPLAARLAPAGDVDTVGVDSTIADDTITH